MGAALTGAKDIQTCNLRGGRFKREVGGEQRKVRTLVRRLSKIDGVYEVDRV